MCVDQTMKLKSENHQPRALEADTVQGAWNKPGLSSPMHLASKVALPYMRHVTPLMWPLPALSLAGLKSVTMQSPVLLGALEVTSTYTHGFLGWNHFNLGGDMLVGPRWGAQREGSAGWKDPEGQGVTVKSPGVSTGQRVGQREATDGCQAGLVAFLSALNVSCTRI